MQGKTTFHPYKKHVEHDITRKIADLGLTPIKCELLQDAFGDERKKERGIIDRETTEEFLAKVESVSSNWDKIERDVTEKTPEFSRYFQRNIQDDMMNGMLL